MSKLYSYIPQDWDKYNSKLNMETNIELGGVATPEKMNHIEEGLIHSNMPISIIIVPSDIEITEIEEKDGRKILTVMTDKIEPKQKPINITIQPSDENTTSVTESKNKKTKEILVKTANIEPKWPENLEITLLPGEKDLVTIEDEDKLRRIIIKSSFLNSCAIKPSEREIVIYTEDWTIGTDYPYEASVTVEADITPSSFVKFTKGSNITKEQLSVIANNKINIIENLDGTFKAVAETLPKIDIPLHVAIL